MSEATWTTQSPGWNEPKKQWRVWPRALALFVVTVALFSRFVFLGQAYLPGDILATWYPWKAALGDARPHNPMISDAIIQFYPQDAFFVSQLRQGVVPLWDPTSLGGHPSLANGWSAELYPPRLLLLATLPEWQALAANLLLHEFLAGLFALLLLRRIGAGSLGSLIGAIAWMLNGYVMVWLEYGHTVTTAALLPLALLLYEESLRRRGKMRWTLLTALVVALSLMSGSIQRGLYLLIALSAYALYRLVVAWLAERRARALLWPLGSYLCAVCLGFALAAVVILPTLELIGASQRSAVPYVDLFPQTLLRLALLASFVAPGIAGGPTWPFDLYGMAQTNSNEFQGYAGLLPLVFGVAALRRPRGPAVFFGLVALISLLLALGSPLYYLFYYLVPGMDTMTPQRILILYAFGLAMLAAFGADELTRPGGEKLARRLRSGLGIALAIGAVALAVLNAAIRLGRERILEVGREFVRTQIYGTPLNPRSLEEYYREIGQLYDQIVAHVAPTSPAVYLPVLVLLGCILVLWLREHQPQFFGPAAALLLSVDLLSFALGYNTTVDPSRLYPMTPAIAFLQKDASLHRVALDTSDGTLFPDILQSFGIQEVGGYESLYAERYAGLMATIESGQPAAGASGNLAMLTRFESPLLDLLNMKYVVRPPNSPSPGERFKLAYSGEVAVYENLAVLPRAFVAASCTVAPDPAAALATIASPEFAPRETVVLEADQLGEAVNTCRDGERAVGQATIRSYGAHEIEVATSSPTGGWLVLADTWDPGWTARIDGEVVRVQQADYALRAIRLPAGEHRVTFTYAPESFTIGLWVSGGALLVVACGFLWPFRQRSGDGLGRSTKRSVASVGSGNTPSG